MDFPELAQYATYFQEQTGMHHFMFDGMAIRDTAEIQGLLISLKDTGIQRIHFTFYGSFDYHDRFAGRKGDFTYMMEVAGIAAKIGLSVSTGIMVTMENLDQLDALISDLQSKGITDIAPILPHAKGRGCAMSHLRLTEEAYFRLPQSLQSQLSRNRYRTEAEWLAMGNFPHSNIRHLTLSLTEENIQRLENMDPNDIILELEAMDNLFYERLPDMNTLAREYGKPENTQLFRFRDLYLQWQKRYLADHPIHPDMTDERNSFSVRIYE